MSYGVVYKISCLENDKCYIGRTKNSLRDRWYQHCQPRSNCLYLKRAIEKYGKESFSIEVIASSWDIENLRELEVLLIKQENTLAPNGYNLINTNKGNGEVSEETRQKLRGRKHTEEWKQEMSIRATAYMNDSKNKEKYIKLRQGKTWDELFGVARSKEIRAQLSESRKQSPMVCAGWNKGIPMSDEQKQALHQANQGRDPWNKGIKTGIEPANKGIPMSDEQKQKLSDAHMGKPATWNKGLIRTVEQRRVNASSRGGELYYFQDEMRTVAEIAKMVGMLRETLRNRLYAGMSIEAAVKPEPLPSGARLGREVSQDTRDKIATAQKGKPREYLLGKANARSTSGEFGICWFSDIGKWVVRINKKRYGNFVLIDDAKKKRDQILQEQRSNLGDISHG